MRVLFIWEEKLVRERNWLEKGYFFLFLGDRYIWEECVGKDIYVFFFPLCGFRRVFFFFCEICVLVFFSLGTIDVLFL